MAENSTLQRDPDVVTYETFKGLRSDVTPERFGPEDLAVGVNIDIDKTGRIARRDGYTRVLGGGAHSLWADELQEFCLFVAGTDLMRLSPAWVAQRLAGLASSNRMSFVRVSDRIYFSNAIDTGVIERDARVRSWGLPVPGLPVPTLTVGQMSAGRYQFTLTQLRDDGQESGAPRAGVIEVPEGAGLDFALPTAAPEAVARVLYLSTPNGEVLYAAVQLDAQLSRYRYTGDTLALNLPLATQFLQAAPAGQLVTYYRGRLYVAAGDVLYPSAAFGYELFDLREYVPLDGRITMLAPMTDKEIAADRARGSGLFVGTDRSCGVLVGADPSDFQYVPKADYGAIPGALAYVDGALFGDDSLGARALPMWLTTQGLCVGMPDMAIRNLTRSHYTFAASGWGAALFMPGPNRFIATANL
jgi:hypothetical protein